MRPLIILGEMSKESGGGDGTGRAAADVLQIGEIGFQLLFIFVEQRQLPCFIVYRAGSAQQFIHQFLIVAQQTAGSVAECDDAGAGKGGHVHYRLWFELGGVSERVAQNQTAFGVGVEDFDGGAVHGGNNITRFAGTGIGHVFASGHHGNQVNRQFGAHGGHECADHAGGTAHIVFHFVHRFAGFQRNAAGIKGDAFADQHQRCGVFVDRALIIQFNQIRRFYAAFGHRPKRTHVVADIVLLQNFGGCTGFFRFCFSGLRQKSGGADVGRSVAQVFAQIHAIIKCLSDAKRFFGGCRILRQIKRHLL